MSIEQTDLIDIIGTNRVTGHVVLTVSDHLLECYPDAKGRPIDIEVVLQFPPDDEGRAFLSRVRTVVESAGFGFRDEVWTGARFN
jgi:hypothetical protein